MRTRSLLVLCVLLIVLAAGGLTLFLIYGDRVRAYSTLTQMNELSQLIEHEQRRIRTATDVPAILEEHGRQELLIDSWGNRIEVEINLDVNGALCWRLRSLGKDGKAGACCRGRVSGAWTEDAVLESPRNWRQYWGQR